MEAEIRRQEKLNRAEEQDFRRGKLLEKFMTRMLYGWDDGKFKEEYLKKLERNWRRWKAVSLEECYGTLNANNFYFSFLLFF